MLARQVYGNALFLNSFTGLREQLRKETLSHTPYS